jgi:hypothetical protein
MSIFSLILLIGQRTSAEPIYQYTQWLSLKKKGGEKNEEKGMNFTSPLTVVLPSSYLYAASSSKVNEQ